MFALAPNKDFAVSSFVSSRGTYTKIYPDPLKADGQLNSFGLSRYCSHLYQHFKLATAVSRYFFRLNVKFKIGVRTFLY